MSAETLDYRLGIVCCMPGAYDGQGRLCCNHSIGRLLDELRDRVPGARLCIPVVPQIEPFNNYPIGFRREEIVELPPLETVIRSQAYFFQTRRIVRAFARTCDVLFMRLPFQVPMAVAGIRTPKLLHVVGNAYNVIQASSNYRGIMRKLALRYAAHTNATIRRMVREPNTRVATNGREMWDLLGCRHGRVVVSSCIYQREMRPREHLTLGDPPRLLFVAYLRPEKGIGNLLEAFEAIRRKRPLKLTLVGGADNVTNAERLARKRIDDSPFRDDITVTGMVEFGEPLFELYRNHDLYVLPSLSEGTPRTLVEARAFGCPAVATRVGGVPSSVDDGRTGLLVEPNDSVGLAAAIERLLNDEPLRRHLIHQGLSGSHEHSLEYFTGQLVEEMNILASEAGCLAAGSA